MIATLVLDGDVQVWQFPCVQPVDAAILSADERERAARFRDPAHRDAYIVQHAITRILLSRYVTGPIELTRGARGKPHLAGIEHNLSHCADLALLAIASRPVGVDIERRDALDPTELAALVLAPDERELDFFRVWCRKEACLKATGLGLVDHLPAISVARDRVEIAGEIVHVRDLTIDAHHAAALALTQPHWIDSPG